MAAGKSAAMPHSFKPPTAAALPVPAGGDPGKSAFPLRLDFLRALARCWIAFAAIAYVIDLLLQTRQGLTNGAERPFGDDFLNYWSAAYLAWRGSVAGVYDWHAFHAFQQSVVGAGLDFYHYSYPPILLVLTAPLALLPYIPALGVWLTASWYAFYRALRLAWPGRGALVLALAIPALFVNALGGQNGAWTAALLGGGLCLLERRPVVAGMLFGLLAYKPQLGILLPVALIAGRQWRALAAAGITVAALVVLSIGLFGLEAWSDYLRNLTVLRQNILEDGAGVWHRMVSVFVFVRRLGLDVPTAYLLQAIAALAVAAVVALAWRRDYPAAQKNALLVLGTCLATPYLQDYDLVFGGFIIAWLAAPGVMRDGAERQVVVISAAVLLAPLVASPLGKLTGVTIAPLLLIAAFGIAVKLIFAARPHAGTPIAQS